MILSNKRLEICNFKLNTLLSVTQAINETHSEQALLNRFREILQNDLNIGRQVVYMSNDIGWHIILSAGIEQVRLEIIVEKDLYQFDDINFLTDSPNPLFKGFDIVLPVINNGRPLAYILIGDIDEEMDGVSPTIKHLHFVQTLANLIIVAIQNIRYQEKNIEKLAFQKELELASKMQNMLIPNNMVLPDNDLIRVKAFYHPHFEIGGDYYDFIQLDEDNIGFCIADVSGKGIAAALIMSNFQANLRAQFTPTVSLPDLIGILNLRLYSNARGEKFITLFLAKFNLKTKVLEYINAGHNPPIYYEVDTGELVYLSKGCVGLGMIDEIPIVKKGELKITKHSKLLCFTDGLVETLKGEGIESSTQMLEQDVSNGLSIELNIEEIVKNNQVLNNKGNIFDDISILGIELFGD